MEPSISVVVEIPEALHSALQTFLDACPEWEHDRAMSCALSLFLLQNKVTNNRETARIYLDSIFKRPVEQI